MIQTSQGFTRSGERRVDTDPVRGSPDQGREGPG